MIVYNDIEQGSDSWLRARSGLPTASEFSKLITSTGAPSKQMEAYAYTKACEKFAGEPVDAFQGNAWTEAGKEDEAASREHYAFISGHDVSEVGFVTDGDLVDYKPVGVTCGCSPDSLVNDDGLLELKRLKGSLLVEAHLYYKKNGTIKPAYVQQVQGQMMVCEREWVDVVFYNPVLPPLAIRVFPDKKVIAGLKAQIKICNELRDKTLAEIGW